MALSTTDLRVQVKLKNDAYATYDKRTQKYSLNFEVTIPRRGSDDTARVTCEDVGSSMENVQVLVEKLKKDSKVELIVEEGGSFKLVRIGGIDYESEILLAG